VLLADREPLVGPWNAHQSSSPCPCPNPNPNPTPSTPHPPKRDEQRKWRAADVEQRHLDNARALWARVVERNRRGVEEKSEQLKALANMAALIAGFSLAAFMQVGRGGGALLCLLWLSVSRLPGWSGRGGLTGGGGGSDATNPTRAAPPHP